MITLYHLYTIAGLVLALALVYRIFRCAHKWELVDKTEFAPVIEDVVKNGYKLHGENIGWDPFRRVTFIVMRCDRCGAAKKYRLSN